jgi:hypothetical protein
VTAWYVEWLLGWRAVLVKWPTMEITDGNSWYIVVTAWGKLIELVCLMNKFYNRLY